MRTLSKGNYRAVYDPAKEESMSMIAVYRKNLDGNIIPNQQGNGKRNK